MNRLMKRRRALMGMQKKGKTDYVTDGLALHLDAIDNEGTGVHNPTYYDWVDKAGGRVFTQNPSANPIAFADNYFPADGSNYFTYAAAYTNWKTMEIVVQKSGSATMAIFATNSSGSNLFGAISYKSNAILFSDGGSRSVPYKSGVHTYTCDGTNVYVDGVKASSADVTVSWTGVPSQGEWDICTWAKHSYKFSGKLYAVRCYNRKLSEEEIANNAAVDAARFA